VDGGAFAAGRCAVGAGRRRWWRCSRHKPGGNDEGILLTGRTRLFTLRGLRHVNRLDVHQQQMAESCITAPGAHDRAGLPDLSTVWRQDKRLTKTASSTGRQQSGEVVRVYLRRCQEACWVARGVPERTCAHHCFILKAEALISIEQAASMWQGSVWSLGRKMTAKSRMNPMLVMAARAKFQGGAGAVEI